jgi:hypothetical protein
VATTLAARVAVGAGRRDLADAIAGGQQVALAVLDRTGDEIQLIDAAQAELALVATPEDASLVRIADLSDASPVACLDPTTRLWRATRGGASPIATVAANVDPVARRGMVLAAALLTGIAEATRDIGAEHAKTRVQFGRPIGVNQAVKHPCADVATDEHREDAELQALSAKIVATDAAEKNAAATVQILGGMGFTFEHDANLYAKRAYLIGHMFGDTRDALSRLIELPPAI